MVDLLLCQLFLKLMPLWLVFGIRNVLRIWDPALRAYAAEVPEDWFGSERLQQLIDDLFDTKSSYSGAGLASPQINEPLRIF